MWKWLGCLGALVLVVLVIGGVALGSYNSLVGLGQAVDAQWAQVENQYQRRADLIPNLVNTVQGAANFEKSTLEEGVKARASVGQAQVNVGNLPNDPAAFARFQQAQDALSGARLRFPAVVFANMRGMKEKSYFQARAGSDQAPTVNFNFGGTPAPAER